MKVLTTGIHGFVGSNLVAALKDKHTFYGIDIKEPEKEGVKKTFSWNDLKKEVIPKVDAIIHLAGKAHDTSHKSDDELYFKINTNLTIKIFDYFTEHQDIKIFIFFSSVKAAADKVLGDELTEDVIPTPIGPYGESKIKAENYILDNLHTNPHRYEGRHIIILRPCMIHGPGNKGNLNLLYSFISKGIPWPLGAFNNKRTFTSIDNLSFVIEKMLEMTVESGIYNMADDAWMSTNDLIEVICQATGRRPHIWKVRKGVVKMIALVGDFFHLPLNTFRLEKLTENYVVSNDKLKKALGLVRMPIDAREGLIRTIQSFQKK